MADLLLSALHKRRGIAVVRVDTHELRQIAIRQLRQLDPSRELARLIQRFLLRFRRAAGHRGFRCQAVVTQGLRKIAELRMAPLLGALRSQPALDVRAFARMAARLGDAIIAWDGLVAGVDVNPVMVFETGAVALDALVESRSGD
jgi:hypothetical protein